MIYTSIIGKLGDVHDGNAVAGMLASERLRNPDNQSLPLYVDSVTGTEINVAQYRRLIPRATALFQSKFGIKKDDVVGLFGINHIYTPIVHMATLSLGAVLSPANVMYSSEELAHQLRETKPPLLIVFDALVPVAKKACELSGVSSTLVMFSELFAEFVRLTDAPAAAEVAPVALDGKTTPAYYCFSSGTSGLPKGVIITHYNMFSNMMQTAVADSPYFLEIKYSQAVVLPMSHIFALHIGVWGGVYMARKSLVFPKFDLEDFVSKVAKHKIRTMALVPPIVLLLGKTDILDRYPEFGECVELITSGAAPISKDTIGLVTAKAPKIHIVQGYGLTETSPVVHLGARDLDNYDTASIGWLVPGSEAQLVNPETGKVVTAFNTPGELWLRGPQIMAGYLNNEKATKETLTDDGWLKTGDVAIVDEKQRFYIVDRIKELIKSNGHQVAPAELESLFLTHPKVLDAAVIGVYNADKTSEMPRAYLVLAKDTDPKQVVQWFNKRVAKHKRLWGGAVVVDVVPKSASGKILRKELRERAPKDTAVVVGSELAAL